MFIHVPAAWVSTLAYCVMTAAALGTLVWRHPLAEAAQKAAAPLGAAFTFICLVTGSLWGKPMWGTYWVWDARLTSVLVLFLIYLGLIALWQTIEEPGRAARAASMLTLVGFVNIPIVKFSVDWWNTLHQPASVFRLGGPTIDRSMLVAAAGHGGWLHAAVRDPAPHGDPQRDPAPPGAPAAAGCRRAESVAGAHASRPPRRPHERHPASRLHPGRLWRSRRSSWPARSLAVLIDGRSAAPALWRRLERAAPDEAGRVRSCRMSAAERRPAREPSPGRRLLVALPLVAFVGPGGAVPACGSGPAIPRASPRP